MTSHNEHNTAGHAAFVVMVWVRLFWSEQSQIPQLLLSCLGPEGSAPQGAPAASPSARGRR